MAASCTGVSQMMTMMVRMAQAMAWAGRLGALQQKMASLPCKPGRRRWHRPSRSLSAAAAAASQRAESCQARDSAPLGRLRHLPLRPLHCAAVVVMMMVASSLGRSFPWCALL